MLKIHDGRDKNEIRLCDLEWGKFFIWNDLVFRKIELTEHVDGLIDEEDNLAMLMTTGELKTIDKSNWVEPLPDRQIYLEIED